MVQHHHLPDADEIADGVHLFPHLHGDLPVADVHGDGHALERHIQVQSGGLAAAQMLVHRLHPRPPVHAHRRQHVAAVQPVVLYAQHRQILRRQAAVVRPHVRGAQDHDVPRLQPAGRVGVNAVVEQAEALLGLLVDMGHDALPVHGEHGVGGRIHDILQYIHFSSPLLPVLPSFLSYSMSFLCFLSLFYTLFFAFATVIRTNSAPVPPVPSCVFSFKSAVSRAPKISRSRTFQTKNQPLFRYSFLKTAVFACFSTEASYFRTLFENWTLRALFT